MLEPLESIDCRHLEATPASRAADGCAAGRHVPSLLFGQSVSFDYIRSVLFIAVYPTNI
jgi:hypothetical protein